jgi:4-hydroxybenzoate polyprenyltransferase
MNRSLARLALFLRPYLALARLDRPAGFMLLAFPCWWGLALGSDFASADIFRFPFLFLLFFLGAVVMRAAGCAVNDVADMKLDQQVARTLERPVASGMLTRRQALLFAALMAGIGFLLVLPMGKNAVLMALASLPLVVIYPFMKRFTWWPQAFLGLTFNWGALLSFVALQDRVPPEAFLLYAAGFFWTLGYDTIYAFQDVEDDAKAGIKSTARLFGDAAKRMVAFFYVLFAALIVAAAFVGKLGTGFYILLPVVLAQLAQQLRSWDVNSPASSLAVFKANAALGWLVFFAFLAGHFFR